MVQIRSHDEILAILDSSGRLDGVPFMSEMIPFCGQHHRVIKVAHKTCDEHQLRVVTDVVHLEGVRCDGSDHAGCGNRCLLYWKTAWLRKPDEAGIQVRAENRTDGSHSHPTPPRLGKNFVCQATELARAPALSRWQLRQYWQDLRSGNVRSKEILHAIRFLLSQLALPHGTCQNFTPVDDLGLEPGELVEVKSKNEILVTLDAQNKNRGLQFVPEMFLYCGRQFRVLQRVSVRIDPDTGRLVEMKIPCVLLDGVTCRGQHVFCPRANFLLWREAWLRRVH